MKKYLLLLILILLGAVAFSQTNPSYNSVKFLGTDSTSATVLQDGRFWYNPVSHKFRAYVNGSKVTIYPQANIPAKYIVDQATASTAGGTITLDCNSQIQRSFIGSATFSAAKDIALSNTTNAMFFNFIFEVTNVAAVLTVPSDWVMAVPDFDGTDWTPPATGKYEIGGSFDDTANVWYVKIAGPFN